MLAGETFLVLNDSGTLTLVAATTDGYRQLAEAKLLEGPESWGPMALVGGHLLIRDLRHLACFDVAGGPPASRPASAGKQ